MTKAGRLEEKVAVITGAASYITGQALPVDGCNKAPLNLPAMKL